MKEHKLTEEEIKAIKTKAAGAYKRKKAPEAKAFKPNEMTIEREHADGTKFKTSDIYNATDPASIEKLKSIYSNQQIANAVRELGKSTTTTSTIEASDEDITNGIQPRSVKNSNAQKEDYLNYLQKVKETQAKKKELEATIKELTAKMKAAKGEGTKGEK